MPTRGKHGEARMLFSGFRLADYTDSAFQRRRDMLNGTKPRSCLLTLVTTLHTPDETTFQRSQSWRGDAGMLVGLHTFRRCHDAARWFSRMRIEMIFHCASAS